MGFTQPFPEWRISRLENAFALCVLATMIAVISTLSIIQTYLWHHSFWGSNNLTEIMSSNAFCVFYLLWDKLYIFCLGIFRVTYNRYFYMQSIFYGITNTFLWLVFFCDLNILWFLNNGFKIISFASF